MTGVSSTAAAGRWARIARLRFPVPVDQMRNAVALMIAHVVVAVCATCDTAFAQQTTAPSLKIGDLIRGTMLDGRRFSGAVTTVDSGRFVVRRYRQAPLISVNGDSIGSYQLGLPPRRGRGAKRGALIGAGVGLMVSGLIIRHNNIRNDFSVLPSVVIIPVSLGFSLLGSGVGAVVAPTRWQSDVRMAAMPPYAIRRALHWRICIRRACHGPVRWHRCRYSPMKRPSSWRHSGSSCSVTCGWGAIHGASRWMSAALSQIRS